MPPCEHCGTETVAALVPDTLHEHAPESGETVVVCPHCLRTAPADPDPSADVTPDLASVSRAFPPGEGGVAFALAVGLLESLALERRAITACFEFAERSGVDVFLALDRLQRLEDEGEIDVYTDLSRRVPQLESLLE